MDTGWKSAAIGLVDCLVAENRAIEELAGAHDHEKNKLNLKILLHKKLKLPSAPPLSKVIIQKLPAAISE